MDNGIYHVGSMRFVVNDHTSEEAKQQLKQLLDDNNRQKSSADSESIPKSKSNKRRKRN